MKFIAIVMILLLLATFTFDAVSATQECVKGQEESNSEEGQDTSGDNGADDAMSPEKKQGRPYGTV